MERHVWVLPSISLFNLTMVKLPAATLSLGAGAEDENLVMSTEGVKKGCLKIKRMESKNIPALASREIIDRFPDLSYVDAYVRKDSDGKTLFDCICMAKADAFKNKRRLCTAWWSALRLKWDIASSASALFKVDNPAETVPAGLINALTTSTSSNTRVRTPVPLLSWLNATATAPNQKSIIGLFRHGVSKHPATSTHMNVCIAIMKFCSRLNVATSFKKEVSVMSEFFDTTACCWLQSIVRSGMREEVWLKQNLEVLCLVISGSHARKIIASQNDIDVSSELRAMCSSTSLGNRLFGQRLMVLAQKEYIKAVECLCAELMSEEISQRELDLCHQRAAQQAENWEFDKRCSSKTHIEQKFFGLPLNLPGVDSVSAATAVIMTWVKQSGLASGQISPLWFEKACFPDKIAVRDIKKPVISDAILSGINLARSTLNQEVRTGPPASGAMTVEFLEGKAVAMLNNDGSFYIEIALARALTSGPGQTKLEEEVMQQLPNESKHISINSSTMSMSKLRESDLARFCSIEAQNKVEEILQQLRAVQRGHCPCFTAWAGDKLLARAKQAFAFYLHDHDKDEDDAVPKLRGKPLADKIFKEQRAAFASSELSLDQCQRLNCFDWLLTDAQKDDVQSWLADVWKNAGLAQQSMIAETQKRKNSTLPPTKRTCSSSSSNTRPPTEDSSLAMDNVANLFA